jgi:hypothetical protein
MNRNKFTTRTELKSLTKSIKCAETECGRLRMLKVCLDDSSMRLGVPFIAPRQLGAVGGNFGRQILPSIRWRTGQSRLLSGARSPSFSGASDRCRFAALAHRTQSGAHRTVRCPLPTVGAPTSRARIAWPTVGAVDHWLTGQSGVSPDSPVNFSCTPLNVSRERRLRHGRLTGQSGAPPDSPVNYSRMPPSSPKSGLFIRGWPGAPDTVRCTTRQSGAPKPSCIWLYTANSIPNQFLMFLTLRHNTLVLKSMY